MQPELTGGAAPRPRPRRRARRLLRGALIAVSATLMLAVGASSAAAAPELSISKTESLVSGETVEVSGTGFTTPTPTTPGMYVAQTATVNGAIVSGAQGDGSSQWVRSTDDPGSPFPARILDPAVGEFDGVELTVHAKIRDAEGNVLADCRVIQCYISTWQAHGNPVTFFTSTPINFIDRNLIVDPRAGLAPSGTSRVHLAGTGFDPAEFPTGFRLAQAQVSGANMLVGESVLVKQGANPESDSEAELSADGSFFASLDVSPVLNESGGTINCEFASCAIVAWPEDETPQAGSDGNLIANEQLSFAFEYRPVVKLSKSRKLPSTTIVGVSGSGFPGGSPGFYVAQAALVNGEWLAAVRDTSGAASNMKWMRPNFPAADSRLNPDGSFETAISVVRNFNVDDGRTLDCAVIDCYVITWRAHTDPSRNTVFTSSPIVFDDAEAGVRAVGKARIRLGRKARRIPVANIVCGADPCTVSSPKRAILRAGGKRYRLRVTAQSNLGAHKRAVVKLVVPGRVAKKLAGRKGRVKFTIAVQSEAGKKQARINKLLVGPKAKRR